MGGEYALKVEGINEQIQVWALAPVFATFSHSTKRSKSVQVLKMEVFVLTELSLYWPGRRDQVEQPGRIPLEDDV